MMCPSAAKIKRPYSHKTEDRSYVGARPWIGTCSERRSRNARSRTDLSIPVVAAEASESKVGHRAELEGEGQRAEQTGSVDAWVGRGGVASTDLGKNCFNCSDEDTTDRQWPE